MIYAKRSCTNFSSHFLGLNVLIMQCHASLTHLYPNHESGDPADDNVRRQCNEWHIYITIEVLNNIFSVSFFAKAVMVYVRAHCLAGEPPSKPLITKFSTPYWLNSSYTHNTVFRKQLNETLANPGPNETLIVKSQDD